MKKESSKIRKPEFTKARYNLFITFDTDRREIAESELRELLSSIGENPLLKNADVAGVFKTNVSNSRKAIARLKQLCIADPNKFTATYHYTPIDYVCRSDIKQMQECVKYIAKDIGESDNWKMQINKKDWKKKGETELILKLTQAVKNEHVDLKNPQVIVNIEIIGKEAGISLVKPEDILDVNELKRGS